MRAFLDAQGFLEVETPVLQPIPGGANARPFVTHHNALDTDLYLRIAPELYLKRLVVGGLEKVYEVARCFRNEGIDPSHNPEFTMLELYWAYADKEAFISMIEEMLARMVKDALGTDIGAPFPRLTFREAVLKETGIDIDELKNEKDVIAAVKKAKVKVDFKNCVGLGEYLDELYKKTARAKLEGPVWVFDYPVEMKPLSARVPGEPTKSASAQLVMQGAEIVNAYYHELHNPIDQRERFEHQQALAEKGSEEAQRMDTAFLEALEHGMPPTSGFGMGIDRLAAILTGSPSLKEVILFPTLRPKAE
jgi:lysyl-tRNA synthetase class 2